MRQLIIFMIFTLAVQACGRNPEISTPTLSRPTKTPHPTSTAQPTEIGEFNAVSIPMPGKAERVIIISFDGLRPDAITEAPMNNLIHWCAGGQTY